LNIMLAGCHGPSTARCQVDLAGAHVSVELIASWLSDSRDPRVETRQVSPVQLSQIGFEKLAARECDIACTDRPITPREAALFEGEPIEGLRVGFYGYALYVHPDNPLDSVFAGHLTLLFQRRITEWSQLFTRPSDAFDGAIRLIGPEKGTRGGEILARQARIWFDDPTWEVMPSDSAVIHAVADDPFALGFASIGYDGDVRYLGLRMQRTGPPVFPSLEEIESEEYGLAKVIYIYYRKPESTAVQAVRDFLFSAAGEAAMAGTSVWALPQDRARVPGS
jgi:phosphate transport system substrate-binding protein